MSGVPSLATDQVAARLPLNTIGTAGAVRVGDGRSSIGPPGEEVSIVGALLVGSDLSLVEAVSGGVMEAGKGDDAGDGGTGRHKRGEADHYDEHQRLRAGGSGIGSEFAGAVDAPNSLLHAPSVGLIS
jgi:hypothetical protein